MIVRGQVGLDELSDASLQDPDILRVSRATTLIDDDELTRISIDKRWAQVTLILNDGRRIEDAPRTPRGDADNPLSDQEISDKFHNLADTVLGPFTGRGNRRPFWEIRQPIQYQTNPVARFVHRSDIVK